MKRPARRGASAVIAMLILSVSGLSIAATARSGVSDAEADSAAAGGWRALYGVQAGIAAALAGSPPPATPGVPPQIAAEIDVTLKRIGPSEYHVESVAAHSSRSARITIDADGAGPPVLADLEATTPRDSFALYEPLEERWDDSDPDLRSNRKDLKNPKAPKDRQPNGNNGNGGDNNRDGLKQTGPPNRGGGAPRN